MLLSCSMFAARCHHGAPMDRGGIANRPVTLAGNSLVKGWERSPLRIFIPVLLLAGGGFITMPPAANEAVFESSVTGLPVRSARTFSAPLRQVPHFK
jgi:hypothetical protein